MARTNVLNSATSQFFFNIKDNLNLDSINNSGGYAVFGEIVEGLNILDVINSMPGYVYDSSSKFPIPQIDGPLIIEAAYKLEALNTTRPEIRLILAGDGTGIVSSSPKGLKCGTPTNSVCQTSFDATKTIKLTAKPASNSIFGGWRGDCKGVLPGLKVALTRDSKAQDANCTAVFRKK